MRDMSAYRRPAAYMPAAYMIVRIIAICLFWAASYAPLVAQEAKSMLVRVEKIRNQAMTQTVSVIGRLVSLRMGNIAARIAGPVEGISIEVGDHIKKGQVIAVLDAETLIAEAQMANSELDEARAELLTWRAETDVAMTELKRQEGLRKSVAFSQAKFEDAQKRVAVAEARVGRARARVAVKLTSLQRKQIDVEYATVRAPYPGVVIRRYTEAGSYVNKGDPIARVIGDRALEVEAAVPYARLAGLPIGRIVDITLDDGTRHKAKVRSILPSENPQTRTRMVRFVPEFFHIRSPLAESQTVTIAVPVSDNRNALTVHKDAILKRPSGDIVFVVTDGTAQPRPITLGEAVGGRFEVVSGLKEGEQVVIRGNERVQPGMKVRVEKDST